MNDAPEPTTADSTQDVERRDVIASPIALASAVAASTPRSSGYRLIPSAEATRTGKKVRLSAALIATLALTTAGCTTERRALPIPLPTTAETSAIYDGKGNLITILRADQNRVSIPLTSMPRALREAIVAIEDRRFWEHNGVDPRAIGRAVTENADAGGTSQGGSTITQQYVKNALLTDEKSLSRKIEEASLALELERTYSKERILELYLNTVFYGNGAYGIEAASGTYFGKSASELSLVESAMLAGIVQSPSADDPFRYPEKTLERRNVVLKAMLEEGYIDVATHAAAIAAPLGIASTKPPAAPTGYMAPHFVDAVKEWFLTTDELPPDLGNNREERSQSLYGGGLRIYTTIDPERQAQGEEAISSVLTRPGSSPDGALVSIDPRTGYILAMVGGYNYWGDHDYAQVNLAMGTGRPTGSSFKGITLATALDKGYKPEDVFPSPQTVTFPGNPPWKPSGGGGLGGPATLRQCAENSSNTCFAYLSVKVLGPETIRDMAYKLGVTEGTLRDADGKTYGPITLGPYNTTVLDMASVYATFANRGVKVPPVFVSKITRADGSIVFQHQHTQEKVLEPDVAYNVADILRGVILRGTGKQNGQIGRDAAGKTGTVEVKNNKANTDIWFCGFTPDLATAVWVGYAEPIKDDEGNFVRLRDLGNRQGGDEPTLIWARFMRAALANVPLNQFAPPPPKALFEERTPEIKEFSKVEAPTYVQMPNVAGVTAEEAKRLISERNLNVDIRVSPTQPGGQPGVVIAQSPAPGYTLSVGSRVTIEISEGTPIGSIALPSIIGTPLAEAQQFLTATGFTVEVIPQPAPQGSVRPDGTPLLQNDVWGQTPSPGETTSDGKVQLFYQP